MSREPSQPFAPVEFPVGLGGLRTAPPAPSVYPGAIAASNVRWSLYDTLIKRTGFVPYNTTAMPTTVRAVSGIFQFNRRDTTTRYTIVADQEKIFVCPTSGSWTTLVSSLTATASDYWDAVVFNNEMILVNGVDAPQVTNGTAGGTSTLTSGSATQVRTSMTSAQSLTAGLLPVADGYLLGAAGATAAGAYDGRTQLYDTEGDAWSTKTRANVNRDESAGFVTFGRAYVVSGNITGPALTATGEYYELETDTWHTMTNITTAVRSGRGAGANNGGFVQTGNNNASASAWVTTNQRYDPVTDTWSTKTAITSTARRQASGFVMSQAPHVVGGRTTVGADNYVATHDEYNPFSDTWTSLTALTAARTYAGGAIGQDNLGYIAGGIDSNGSNSATIYQYNRVTDAWATLSATLTLERAALGAANDNWWMYTAGGAVGANASAVVERLNTSPSAPIAFYVETFKGYVFLARTTSFPSRLFYSAPGNSRIWDTYNYLDVVPDDGDWITGMFVFDGRFYVMKNNTTYQIAGTVFDPEEGDQQPIPLANVPGTVSNRSITVTDHGVYYLAKDGLRLFDGVRSTDISSDVIGTTLAGYVQSRNKYVQGLWVKKYNEVWFSFTSTGSTMDTLVVWNYKHRKFSTFTGMACEAMANVEDANANDQLLFGTGDATDGRIYTADSGLFDKPKNSAANITASYQTGWFSPASGLANFQPKKGVLYVKRQSTSPATLVVNLYANFGATTTATDSLPLDQAAGNSSTGQYFNDATDNRAILEYGTASTSHVHSIGFSDASQNTGFEILGMVLMGSRSPSGGIYPNK